MAQLERNLGHVLLWEQFLRTPREVDAALVSVIHKLMEGDQVLAEWLDDSMARYAEAVRQADVSGSGQEGHRATGRSSR